MFVLSIDRIDRTVIPSVSSQNLSQLSPACLGAFDEV